MLDTPITRAEHEEFRRRIEEEHSRQNRRLELLEESIERLNALNTSIEKLALNMESMLKEQVRQGKRLEVLENRDGEMWRKLLSYAVTTVVDRRQMVSIRENRDIFRVISTDRKTAEQLQKPRLCIALVDTD